MWIDSCSTFANVSYNAQHNTPPPSSSSSVGHLNIFSSSLLLSRWTLRCTCFIEIAWKLHCAQENEIKEENVYTKSSNERCLFPHSFSRVSFFIAIVSILHERTLKMTRARAEKKREEKFNGKLISFQVFDLLVRWINN